MKNISISSKHREEFHLNKWFLDFICENGDAMIFYVAKLKWRGIEVPYTSWLYYKASTGVTTQSRFRKIYLPEIKDNIIYWNDKKFNINGSWESLSDSIQARLFDSAEGYLYWNCIQPYSKVHLKINESNFNGDGYAEQLILTIAPWKIPMNELRWGRFSSQKVHLVWIELRGDDIQQWIWFNGEKIENAIIEDHQIVIPSKKLRLALDRGVELESEKKILQVVKSLIRYLPNFNKSIPMQFLTADEFKWLSRGILQKGNETIGSGWAIHEFVNFKPNPK